MAVLRLDIPDETLAELTRLVERGGHGTVPQIIERALAAWMSNQGPEGGSAQLGSLDILADEGEASGEAVPFDGPTILQEIRARLAATRIAG